MNKASLPFRYDIAGLRAWAVIAVVLFHFNIPGFSGGFVGVDIFFVLSGYLMTKIILNGLEGSSRKPFTIIGFYLARARRIIPALLLLCAVLLVLGWFILPPTDYKPLAVHALTSVLFLSNIQYFREAGYFDAASHDKWLLHTWSLSVEWQFYLLLPLLLWFVWKLRPTKSTVLTAIIMMLIASFVYSVWLTSIKPAAAFFLFPARAWEMLTGGLVVFASHSKLRLNKRLIENFGFSLIAISILTADPSTWPGWQALLPVIGTFLVLVAGNQNSLLTAPKPMQKIGDWSYSIYLWHWPFVVALVYAGWQEKLPLIILSISLSLLLGWGSFKWVEPLAKNILKDSNRYFESMVFFAAVSMVALPAFFIYLKSGVAGRLSPQVEMIAAAAHDYNKDRKLSHTMSGLDFKSHLYGNGQIKAIVWGDSHASTLVLGVQEAFEGGVVGMSYSACPTVFGFENKGKDLYCAQFNDWALDQVRELPQSIPVIIVNRNAGYSSHVKSVDEYYQGITDSACEIAKTHPVYLVRPLPTMPVNVPKALARSVQFGNPRHISMTIERYYEINEKAWKAQNNAAEQCGVEILNPIHYLCDEEECLGADGYLPRYYDDNHISKKGSKLLLPMFKKIANDLDGF